MACLLRLANYTRGKIGQLGEFADLYVRDLSRTAIHQSIAANVKKSTDEIIDRYTPTHHAMENPRFLKSHGAHHQSRRLLLLR